MTRSPLLLAVLLLGVSAVRAQGPEEIGSKEELGRVVGQLDDPATEMPALGRLIRFVGILWNGTGSIVWLTGDPVVDALRREARAAVTAHRSVEVVQRALCSEDLAIRFWAVNWFESDDAKPGPWKPLLPRLEEIAAHDPDAYVRAGAIQRLGFFDEGRAFIKAQRRSTDETDPWALMTLYGFDSGHPSLRAKWYACAARFLVDDDEALRTRWLMEVWLNVWNPSTAPCWRIGPDTALLRALRRLAKVGAPDERQRARWTVRLLEKKARPGDPPDSHFARRAPANAVNSPNPMNAPPVR